MDGDRHNSGSGTGGYGGGGDDQGPSRQGLTPLPQTPSGKYVPPHLRNQGSGAGNGPHAPSLQRQGLGSSTGAGPSRRSRDPPPPSRRTSQLPSESCTGVGETHLCSGSKMWKFLSYNVWFREDLEMHMRMKAVGDLIELHAPDVICFQEVTSSIYEIFQQSSWWKGYQCSISDEMAFPGMYFCMQCVELTEISLLRLSKLPVKSYSCRPFHNSIMGRELCVAEIEVQPDMTMVVATSHLESPCPRPPTWDQMFSKERVEQAKVALRFLKKNQNVIFSGDMNWDDELDGPFPLHDGWIDAWTELRPGEVGWTYDTKSNKMLSGNRPLQKRLDRFICKLKDFTICKIEMIGRDAIRGLSYIKEKRFKGQVKELELPVLPSDHYGLLLTICAGDST